MTWLRRWRDLRSMARIMVASGFALAMATVARAAELSLWIAPIGGYSSYTMDDINDRIDVFNQIYRPEFRLDHIEGGAAVGGQIGLDIDKKLVAAVGYERLWGESSSSTSDYDVAANVIEAIGGYRPFVTSTLRAGFDLGLGAIIADGEIGNVPTTQPLSGTGPVFDGTFALDYLPWQRLGAMVRIGYRSAVIDKANETPDQSEALNLDLDYSGFLLRGGVRVILW